MTDTVDPMIVDMPLKWRLDPDIEPFMDYFIRWAHDMTYAVTGGTGTSIIPDYPFESMLHRIQTYLEEAGVDEGYDNSQLPVLLSEFQDQLDGLKIEILNHRNPPTEENFNQRYAFMLS